MAGPIRISVLAEASKARKELATTEKSLGGLGNAGDKASGKLKALATSVEPAFARLRAEANKALESIPRDAAGSIDKTAREFQQLSPEMKKAVQAAARVAAGELRSGAFAQAGERAGEDAGEGFKTSLTSSVKSVGPALAGALAAAGAGGLFAEALQQTGDRARLGASLGLSDREAEQYGRAAGRLYAGAYAESVGEAGTALASVRNSFRNLDNGEIEAASRRALSFADIFETDVSRATQIAGQAVRNGLAKDATEAFDLLTAASQKVPPSLREDVLDAAEEYGGFFRQLGYDGDQAFSTLVRGADKGMFGIDKAGDAIKEFSLLSTDLSTSSREAYGQIGLDAEKMADRILAGGGSARRATNDIIDGLLALQNPAERANAAVALFGTPIEDLNKGEIPQFLRSLRNGQSELGKFGGAADRAAEQYGNSAQQKLTKFGNGIKQDVTERIVEALPELQATARELNTTFGPTLKQAGEIAQTAGEFFAELPRPVKEFLGVAGTSALVLPRLSSAIGSSAAGLSTFGASLSTARNNSSQFIGQVRTAETRSSALRGALSRVGPAARGAAGIGGLGALAAGASTSNDGLKTLANVGGGAMLGFATGGPIGGAIGAAGGLLLTLGDNAGKATEKAEAGRRSWQDYAATLDQVTGASTEATGAMAFQALAESNSLAALRQLGISNREAVSAVLGRGDASRRVADVLSDEQLAVNALREEHADLQSAILRAAEGGPAVGRDARERSEAMEEEIATRQRAIDTIKQQTGEVERATGVARRQAAATREFTGSLKGIPRDVRTEIRAGGIEPTRRGLKELIREHDDLGRKRVRTLVRAAGLADTDRGVKRLADRLLRLGRASPNLRPYTRGLTRGVRAAENGVGRSAERIRTRMTGPPNRARTNLNPYARSLIGGLRAAERIGGARSRALAETLERNTERAAPNLRQFTADLTRDLTGSGRDAERGGRQISDRLRQSTGRARPDLGGFNSGISAGVSAGRSIASSGGFSVGSTLKSSVINGFAGTADALASSAAAAVTRAIVAANAAANNRGGGGRREALGRTSGNAMESLQREAAGGSALVKSLRTAASRDLRSVQDRLKALGKEWGRSEERTNSVTAALAKQSKQLVLNARNQARLERQVDNANEALKAARRVRDEYAASIRASFVEYGNLANIEEGHLNSPTSLLDSLREQVQRATRFRDAIAKLRDTSLNATTMKQLLAAGPEQGLAAAEALVAGIGQGTVGQVNELQKQLADMGKTLGSQVANDFESANIRRKLNILGRKQDNLRDARTRGRQIASALLKEFRGRLGGPTGRKQTLAESVLGNKQASTNRARAMGRDLARAQRIGFSEEQRRAQQRRQQALARTSAMAGAPKAGNATPAREVVVAEVRFSAKDVSDVLAGQAIVKRVRAYEKTKARR